MRVFVEATEEDGQGYGMVVRDISPAEILEAARPHADLEAGARARYEHHRQMLISAWEKRDKMMLLPEWDELPQLDRAASIREAGRVVLAALGADDE